MKKSMFGSDFMTEKEMLHNQILAEETVDFDRTITVICDERPGFDIMEARRIINYLRENGYNVMEKDVDSFLTTNTGLMGFLLVIPHASSLPAVCSTHVRHFLERGGNVLTLGGVLLKRLTESGLKYHCLIIFLMLFIQATAQKPKLNAL